MTPPKRGLNRVVFSLPRIKRETFVADAELHRTIDSTNRRGVELAAMPDTPLPYLVLTENQTAGKGRGSNVWWSAPGALTLSLVLDLGTLDAAPEAWARIALAAAVGVCEALEAFAPDVSFGIRWPNDVFVGQRKVCGILPELYTEGTARLVLGIGINANNSMDDAPDTLRERATSLFDLRRRRVKLTDLVVAVLDRLQVRVHDLANGSGDLALTWRERCLLRGCVVGLQRDGEFVQGECLGIDPSGALLLRAGAAAEPYYAGTIVTVTGG